MLSLKNRLRRKADIKVTRRQGKPFRTPTATFYVVQRSDQRPTRIGVVVGRRVDHSAVVRHRVQRLLREIGKDVISIYPEGYDMVVIAQPPSTNIKGKAELQQLVKSFMIFLKNLHEAHPRK